MAFNPPTRSETAPLSYDDFICVPADDILCRVRPTRENNARVRAVVKKVVDAIQVLGPAEVIKGGSYGKGTHLLDRDEADLVVLFQDVVPNLMTDRLASVKKALDGLVQNVTMEDASLQFSLEKVTIDVLVGAFLEEDDQLHVMEFSSTQPKDILSHNLSVVSFELDFIKHQDVRYKDLVRYCKVWRDAWPEWPEDCKPKSYLLELLGLAAYQQVQSLHGSSSIEDAFEVFLELCQKDSFRLAWNRWYDADAALAQTCHIAVSRVLLNPGNPMENIAANIVNWAFLANRAAETQGDLKAMKGPAAQAFKKMRNDLKASRDDAKGKGVRVTELEQRLVDMHMGAQFDLSGKSLPPVGQSLQSALFSLPVMQNKFSLSFYPNGQKDGDAKCAMFLHAPSGATLKFRMLVDGTAASIHEHEYKEKQGAGNTTIVDIQKSYAHIAVQFLRAAYVTPNTNLSVSFEPDLGDIPKVRVTWNTSGLRSAAKGEAINSEKFSVDGVSGMHLMFYPKGHKRAEDGKNSLFLSAPSGSRIRRSLFVGETMTGPDTHVYAPTLGVTNFSAVQQSYAKVGVVIYFAQASVSSASGLHVYS